MKVSSSSQRPMREPRLAVHVDGQVTKVFPRDNTPLLLNIVDNVAIPCITCGVLYSTQWRRVPKIWGENKVCNPCGLKYSKFLEKLKNIIWKPEASREKISMQNLVNNHDLHQ